MDDLRTKLAHQITCREDSDRQAMAAGDALVAAAYEHDALAAHIERLREAITGILPGLSPAVWYADEEGFTDQLMTEVSTQVGVLRELQRASAATPERSLAKLKAKTKREVASELERLRDYIQDYLYAEDARDDIRRICASRAKDLRSEADRLEQEAK